MPPTSAEPAAAHRGMSYREFVALLAACMSLNALSIDVMIPALPHIASEFALAGANLQQAVIAIYVAGMGVSQLVYGPLADRYGRRPVLLAGLAIYVLASAAAASASSFAALLLARTVQGIGAGAPRVISLALARDCYSGTQMGRLMSFVMTVFMLVPILAPALGQLILLAAPWRAIFAVLVAGGVLSLAWVALRLPETLHPSHRRSIAPGAIAHAMAEVFRDRQACGYSLALAIMTGSLLAFVTSVQQVFVDVYRLDGRFTLIFGGMATFLAAASFANARLVTAYGMRRVAHTALTAHFACSAAFVLAALAGSASLAVFVVAQTVLLALFGLMGANFNVLALERMAHVAGSASSMVGFVAVVLGAVLGFAVGQLFDGSVLPLAAGNLVLAAGAIAVLRRASREPRQPD